MKKTILTIALLASFGTAGVKAVAALPTKIEPAVGTVIGKGAAKVNEIIDDAFHPKQQQPQPNR